MPAIHALLIVGYTRKELAKIIGVSYKILLRRLAKDPPKSLTTEELDAQIEQIVMQFPAAGQRLIQGTIWATGVTITRKEIQQALMRVDPLGLFVRMANRMPRRVTRYWVPYANAVWHFDGHEKLKRFVPTRYPIIQKFSNTRL